LDDEHSWLPPLLEVASNPKILLGRPGYIDCSIDVQVLEAPAIMDRSEGDLHLEIEARTPKTIFAIIRSTR
jgi:zinc/manganese transport system substrate-binding protein